MTDGSRPSPPSALCVCGHARVRENTMTGPTSPPSALCVCGHARAHHGKQELAQLPYDPRCQWRGCGCPRFLANNEGAGQEASRPLDKEAADLLVKMTFERHMIDGRAWRWLTDCIARWTEPDGNAPTAGEQS